DYKRRVSRVDAIDSQPYKLYRAARRNIMASSGTEQVALWIKYHILEPQFDQIGASMPNLGLSNQEAERISNYLVERNIGSTGVSGFVKRFIHPYIYGPIGRRHLPGA